MGDEPPAVTPTSTITGRVAALGAELCSGTHLQGYFSHQPFVFHERNQDSFKTPSKVVVVFTFYHSLAAPTLRPNLQTAFHTLRTLLTLFRSAWRIVLFHLLGRSTRLSIFASKFHVKQNKGFIFLCPIPPSLRCRGIERVVARRRESEVESREN